ncbi:MAG: aminotransferase class III-fold pyridoxal phosphate-dependent enzyme [Mariprofundus sp.]|nr:aminotransferase class III-fold pyridoxal phosphate-dependent enzyme [Mariprofundus sp.]
MTEPLVFGIIVSLALFVIYHCWIRLRLSRAKHRSMAGHSKWSRRIAGWIPSFDYNEQTFFASDGAPEHISQKRQQAFHQLARQFQHDSPNSIAFSESLDGSISDVHFTNAYRVPFPYRKYLHRYLKLGSVVEKTDGVRIKDMDGNWSYDLTGSYGVNLFGYDFYKDCMEKAWLKVKELGPVLGPYHPLIRENVDKLKSISGLDEVSFHMSGTEAVMQAVRMARYHSGKTHLVRFCGAYHGWWDGVQPGIGNQRKTNDVYTLSDMSVATLKVLETRNDIACVLINPLQALHPNANASSDTALISSDRSAGFDREAYTRWLQQVRDVCTRRSIVLIFDEVFAGFRLGYRGAQEYYGIQADLVTYGKTLGGGLPVGVLCGRHALMKRFKDDQPVNVSFARGTFNSHPYVMATMNEFLHRIEGPEYQRMYQLQDALWDARVQMLNAQFDEAGLPLHIVNLLSVWTILYTRPSRYNWMYQYYLRAEGLTLSWIGSGRVIMSHNFSDADFEQVSTRFIQAATRMQQDGWWWQSPTLSNQAIKRQMLREMLTARLPWLGRLLPGPLSDTLPERVVGES